MNSTLADIITIVRVQLGAKQVAADQHLVEHLGAASADIVNIVVALEEKYGIHIDEEALGDIATPNDLHRLVEARL